MISLLQTVTQADVVSTHYSTNWWEALADNETVPERMMRDGDEGEFTLVRSGGNGSTTG